MCTVLVGCPHTVLNTNTDEDKFTVFVFVCIVLVGCFGTASDKYTVFVFVFVCRG